MNFLERFQGLDDDDFEVAANDSPGNDGSVRDPHVRVVRRREFPRWELHAAVNLESEDCLYAGISYDVSAGGLFIATAMAPPVGAAVAVKVMLPDGRRLDLLGTVRWVRDPEQASPGLPSGCGVEWVAIDEEALAALLHFATMREPLFWEAA